MQLLYDRGGWLPSGVNLTRNGTGQPEAVLTSGQWDSMRAVAESSIPMSPEVLAEAVARGVSSALDGRGLELTGAGVLSDSVAARITMARRRA